MTDLAEFLLARIADDEAVARAAGARDQTQWTVDEPGCCVRVDDDGYLADTETHFNGAAEHIARWDPARVLAECEAKRQIMLRHQGQPYPNATDEPIDLVCSGLGGVWNPTDPDRCPELRALALPYADHPDYRQEWRP